MLTKKRLLSLLWGLTCLTLWVLGFLWTSFILMLISWCIVIWEYPLEKKIKKSIGMAFLFLIFYIASMFRIFELTTNFSQPCWSSDGKHIVFFMNRHLERRRPGIMGWIGINIWDKYYICTMNHNGENFKVAKQVAIIGAVSWSGSCNIVYTQKTKKQDNKEEQVMYKIKPDGNNVERLWEWNEQSDYGAIAWLSPQEEYFVLYRSTDTIKEFAIYDRKKKQIKKTLSYSNVNLKFYGSYNSNEIALTTEEIALKPKKGSLIKYNIDTDKMEKQEIPALGDPIKYFEDYDYRIASRSYSPDRNIYAEGTRIWSKADKLVADYHIKDKRSYLFNIFWK